MSRRWGKRDQSHAAIKAALLAAGRPLRDVAHLAGLGCDFIAEHRDGYPIFLEAKPEGRPSLRKLTPSEIALRDTFPGFFRVVQTADEALRAVGLL
jgi:hypothetical protein